MISGRYFDGRSARPVEVRLALRDGRLVATPSADGTAAVSPGSGSNAERVWPLAQVRWPERTRHGRRVLHLAEGGQIDVDDAAAFDAWRAAAGIDESWVVRVQQHWRSTLVALVLLLLVLAGGYRWGVPWAADQVVAVLPTRMDAAIGDAAFEALSAEWAPSKLPEERRRTLERDLDTALLAAYPGRPITKWQLHIVRGGERLGANALALPGGDIVITDEMLALLEGHEDTVIGVLAHEYGHVRQRHGMRAVARLTLLGLATAAVFGDFSTVLAGVPVLIGHMAYARDAEREADAEAVAVLRGSGRSPAAMVVLFEKMREARQTDDDNDKRSGGLPFAFASHPADEERIRFFRDAAAQRR